MSFCFWASFMYSFWMKMPKDADSDVHLIRYRYDPSWTYSSFLYIENKILKFQYYTNGTFHVYTLPDFKFESFEQYTIQLSSEIVSVSFDFILLDFTLISRSRNDQASRSFSIKASRPRPTVSIPMFFLEWNNIWRL